MSGPRADGAARSAHTILAAPVGQTYDRLLRGGAASCGECWLGMRPGLALSANARRALKRLRPFLIAAEARGEWLGTRLVGHTPPSTRPCARSDAPRPRRAAVARRGGALWAGPCPRCHEAVGETGVGAGRCYTRGGVLRAEPPAARPSRAYWEAKGGSPLGGPRRSSSTPRRRDRWGVAGRGADGDRR